MLDLNTKSGIVNWYERSMASIDLRRRNLHPRLWKISEADYQFYFRSIQSHFRRLKKLFNENLKNATQ